MTLSPDELRSKIEQEAREAGGAENHLEADDVPAERAQRLHFRAAIRRESIGVYRFVLGEDDAARESLRQAAVHFLHAVLESRAVRYEPPLSTWRNEPIRLTRGLFCAIVGGATETRDEIARASLELGEDYLDRYPAVLFYRSKTLGAIVRDDDRRREYLESFRGAAASDQVTTWDRPLARVCAGIVEDEATAVESGIEGLCRDHRDWVDGEPDDSSELLSLRASATVVLARERGFDVGVESRWLPDALLE